MRLSELDYDLPEELIAQEPLARRDEARLLVLDRKSKSIEHSRFYKLVKHLREGDLLVLNDTRVLPARLFAQKESGGRVELLMVRPASPAEGPAGAWLALIRTHRVLKENARLLLGDGHVLRVAGYARPGRPIVVAEGDTSIEQILQLDGTLALPHYIHHIHRTVGPADIDDYQTVYAARPGAIAAPTAGLHFTDDVFKALADAGIRTATVTLHIGPGTFAPVRAIEVESHTMESEWYTIPPATRAAIEHARRIGGRIITVGTSSTRALESWAITGDVEGFTGLFIHQGFRFKLTDAMLTNFHMPRTTVLALAMAFAGRDQLLAAYREAIRHRYRFLSYGDAMLIL
ncbi:MAG TPA: tRNA preQ1(34) S-adenosylmethionine ribosyltransferase-isomerase QueA [Candidatus Binatus sp.]|uniref:tRNA preQ1(34) S-adenosylmethionine ribosyltransferase-isomerase QueA n=1 Tax=Candidatus Binatus sp. TaxID=2811406 RepID=UPI002B4AA25B|nr:tRNA preQ1(34) S-adenosylmethionine ribosyltransferase-isomerase QueA [Candidatus Binatus sp.]HKN14014.1 tRNA preQ1(34) S-adenosylmethionine ribosyltransferase-isomerase QueA [Candidatus Binatus sp.]